MFVPFISPFIIRLIIVAYSSGLSQIKPFFPDRMTSRFPITLLTKHLFFKNIASSKEIGSPSHKEGKMKKSEEQSVSNAFSRVIYPVTSILGEVSSDFSSPSPIHTKRISGSNCAI